jgi:phage terminase Nu1 subunit (DNA packaging protein)
LQREAQSVSWLAVNLGMDRRTLNSKLEGLKPASETKTKRGIDRKYFVRDVVDAIWARGSGDAEYLDPDQERARKDKETADKLSMENAARRRELVDIASVSSVWIDQMAGMRAKLLSMPTKLGPQLINVPDARIVADKIQDEVHSALNELAELSFDSEEVSGERQANIEGTAQADGEPVGRRGKKAKQRVKLGARAMAN